jgi:AcrR family transcriptional regulator
MVTTRSRREEYAEATNAALVESAAACFYEQGYAATSLDEVARRARVTKGAIYHHFASKRDLFMAVLEQKEEEGAGKVAAVAAAATDAWSGLIAGLDAFLDSIADPRYQRLCWVEGPAALGFEDWWECGERHEIEMIRGMLTRAAEAGILRVEDVDMLAHVIFGSVCAGVLRMARSASPAEELDRFRAVVLQMMTRGVISTPEDG